MSSLAPKRIGEPASPLRLQFIPVASVALMSALPMMLPIIANSALMPPLGLLMFLSWRLLHPSLWPVWIGLPLGLWDDCLSGQPMGSAMGLWTITILAIDFVDQRTYWRGYWQDWLIAAIAIAFVQFSAAAIAHNGASVALLGLQTSYSVILGILLFPVVVRIAARLDYIRLVQR